MMRSIFLLLLLSAPIALGESQRIGITVHPSDLSAVLESLKTAGAAIESSEPDKHEPQKKVYIHAQVDVLKVNALAQGMMAFPGIDYRTLKNDETSAPTEKPEQIFIFQANRETMPGVFSALESRGVVSMLDRHKDGAFTLLINVAPGELAALSKALGAIDGSKFQTEAVMFRPAGKGNCQTAKLE